MEKKITRRGFLTGAAMLGTSALAAGMVGCAESTGTDETKDTSNVPSTSDITWDDEADIVIMGGGCAGYSALTTVHYENLGTALLLEAAPEVEQGGNSRVSGQGVFCPKTVESAIEYQNKCNASYKVPDDIMRSWAENICENVDWMVEAVGFEPVEKGGAEFPEYDDGTGNIVWYAHQGKGPAVHTWKLFVDKCAEYGAKVYFDSRVVDFVFDPTTGEICGVTTEDGRNFKANKGVLLAAGGFEANQEMMNNYLECGFPGIRNLGSPWNKGDAIKMAQSVGADLWHMNNVSGNSYWVKGETPDGDAVVSFTIESKDYIYVAGDGNRYTNEDASARHGKQYRAGVWCSRTMPENSYCIMGEAAFTSLACGGGGFYARTETYNTKKNGQELLEAGIVTKCETVDNLATVIGCPVEQIQNTLTTYNGYVEANDDLDFGRQTPVDADNPAFQNTSDDHSQDIQLAAVEAPYYIFKIVNTVINTQGGPKRGTKGEVLDVKGNPIPRLYAAGEMGCIYGYQYNLGGNFSEAISSGRLAARSISELESI